MHLEAATSADHIIQQVKRIPALRWHQACLIFSQSSQFRVRPCVSSYHNDTDHDSDNSMNSVRVGQFIMVALCLLRYQIKQHGYSIDCPACQYRYPDSHEWDSHIPHPPSWPVWNWYRMLSPWWLSWMFLPIRALSPLWLVAGVMYTLVALELELTESFQGGKKVHSASAMDTIFVLERFDQKGHSGPYRSVKTISGKVEWLHESGCAPSEPLVTLRWRIPPHEALIPWDAFHNDLHSKIHCFLSLCPSPI